MSIVDNPQYIVRIQIPNSISFYSVPFCANIVIFI